MAGPEHRPVPRSGADTAAPGRSRARAGRLLGRVHRPSLRAPSRHPRRAHHAQPRRRRHRRGHPAAPARARRAQRLEAHRPARHRRTARRSRRLGVSDRDRRGVPRGDRTIGALRAPARAARGVRIRGCDLERHRRRGAHAGARRSPGGSRAGSAPLHLAGPDEPGEASAAVPGGGRRQRRGRRRRDRRGRGAAARRRADRRPCAAPGDPVRRPGRVCGRARAHRGRRRRRADLDRLRDPGDDAVRGGDPGHPDRRERSRHRGGAARRAVGRAGGRGRRATPDRRSRGHPAHRRDGHRGPAGARAGSAGRRRLPAVLADRSDARRVRARARPLNDASADPPAWRWFSRTLDDIDRPPKQRAGKGCPVIPLNPAILSPGSDGAARMTRNLE
ncbi:hypothetical protein MICRO8M_10215 [Microbacterium sp. 8M]|nr:hypothetical protein MICRO8M_10215 [Microbacterium sp. 8M]